MSFDESCESTQGAPESIDMSSDCKNHVSKPHRVGSSSSQLILWSNTLISNEFNKQEEPSTPPKVRVSGSERGDLRDQLPLVSGNSGLSDIKDAEGMHMS
ncbi:hypothetical protein PIB30_093012 [Stylosanthes scabra]|uniref:Uncharacterized protein n=1 Tax=Stylosanthes scabra TaxID=79078 RepID=A0ABU6WTB5_9FABA|nr:hypothetical protein [Stylosanthes scabra]